MKKTRYEIEGQGWFTISRAAKLLGTNALGLRKLMGEGLLEWRQVRTDSKTFVVAEDAVMELRRQRPLAAPKRREPFPSKPPFEPQRRVRGGLWQQHHLRMTLPSSEESTPKK